MNHNYTITFATYNQLDYTQQFIASLDREEVDFSRIVAVKCTGNVFSYEALNELNFKPKKWTDLVSGESFERSDVITLQNPNDWSKRQVEQNSSYLALFFELRARLL